LKNIDAVAPAQAKVYKVALATKYFLSLKRLDTPEFLSKKEEMFRLLTALVQRTHLQVLMPVDTF